MNEEIPFILNKPFVLSEPHSITANGQSFEIYPWNHCGRQTILETIDETINYEVTKHAAQRIVYHRMLAV